MTASQFWFIDRNGQQQGAVSIEGLRAAVASQQLAADGQVYDSAAPQWIRAADSPALVGSFGAFQAYPAGYPPYPLPPGPGFPQATDQTWAEAHLTVLKPLTFALAAGAIGATVYQYRDYGLASGLFGEMIIIAACVVPVFVWSAVLKHRSRGWRWAVWPVLAAIQIVVELTKQQ